MNIHARLWFTVFFSALLFLWGVGMCGDLVGALMLIKLLG